MVQVFRREICSKCVEIVGHVVHNRPQERPSVQISIILTLDILILSMIQVTPALIVCRKILCCVDSEWANLVDISGVHGFELLTAKPCSMVAGLVCKHFFKDLSSNVSNRHR
jgi:hypothetical protein